MKKIFTIIVFALFTLQAQAAPIYATGVSHDYSVWNVDGVNWTPILPSTAKSVKGVSVLNTGAYTFELGINYASSASAGDRRQLLIPASMSVPIYFPLVASGGMRISLRRLDSTAAANSGRLDLTAFHY